MIPQQTSHLSSYVPLILFRWPSFYQYLKLFAHYGSNFWPVLHHAVRNSARISTGHSSISTSWPRRISVLSRATAGYLSQRWLRMLRDECGWHGRAIQQIQILVVSPVWTQPHLIGIVISHGSKDLPALEFSSWNNMISDQSSISNLLDFSSAFL